MTSESSFVDFGDFFLDVVAADLFAQPGLPYNPDFLAFEGEGLSQDIFGLPPPPQVPHLSTIEHIHIPSLERPPEAPPALGGAQDGFHSLQPPHEVSYSQPWATTPSESDNALSTVSHDHDEVAGAELWFTGPTQSSGSALPIPLLPTPPSPLVTALPANWIKVPQRSYDHGKKQCNFQRSEPVSFRVNGRPGINMGDAFRKTFTGLDGRDSPVLQDATGAISCRLLFPGYPANSGPCQIHVLNWTRNRLPITCSKLAHEVAKKVKRYLDHITMFTLDGSVEDRWRVGEGFMQIDDMFLVSLVSVSKGSYQPEIWVTNPPMPRVLAGRE